MQAFSNALLNLYDLAAHTSPENFPAGMLRSLRLLISFDGAAIRIGGTETAIEFDSVTMQEQVFKRDWGTLQDNSKASGYERIITTTLSGLSRPFIGTCHEIYGDLVLPNLYNFSQKLDFHCLLLFGDRSNTGSPAKWLMLYRAKKSVFFNDNEAECLLALWKHLLRAFALNLKNALKEIDTDKSQYGFALVNSQGLVEVADSRFSALLGLEWPDSQVNSALEQIIQKLKKNPSYRGKRIHISMYDKFGYMVCAASRLPLLLTLSPSEQSVAERFALGNCYKKIAQQLDMSPYTVRNHIANVYRKLGINDKATLASLITSSSRQILLHITFGLLPIFCAAIFEFDIY